MIPLSLNVVTSGQPRLNAEIEVTARVSFTGRSRSVDSPARLKLIVPAAVEVLEGSLTIERQLTLRPGETVDLGRWLVRVREIGDWTARVELTAGNLEKGGSSYRAQSLLLVTEAQRGEVRPAPTPTSRFAPEPGQEGELVTVRGRMPDGTIVEEKRFIQRLLPRGHRPTGTPSTNTSPRPTLTAQPSTVVPRQTPTTNAGTVSMDHAATREAFRLPRDPPLGPANIVHVPASVTAAVGEIFRVSVEVQAGPEPLRGVEFHTACDPTKLQVVDPDGTTVTAIEVAAGSPLTTIFVNKVDAQKGRIAYAAATWEVDDPPKGTMPLATLYFKVLDGMASDGATVAHINELVGDKAYLNEVVGAEINYVTGILAGLRVACPSCPEPTLTPMPTATVLATARSQP